MWHWQLKKDPNEVIERVGRLSRAEAAKFLFGSDSALPRFLHKFLPVEPASSGGSLALSGYQVSSTLWLSSPANFNDPFDLRAKVDFEGTVDERRTYLRKQLRKSIPDSTAVNQRVEELLEGNLFGRAIQDACDRQMNEMGICCFTANSEAGARQRGVRTVLMWSHYARNGNRIREACGNDDNDDLGGGMLKGIVEADEVYLGGKEKNKHESKKLHAGRGAVGKTGVLGLRQRGGDVRATVLQGTTAKEIHGLIRAEVNEGSILCTDEHRAYEGMDSHFAHKSVNHSAKEYVNGMASTNGIESVWALLKRGYYGVWHSFSRKHTQRYVNECTFRLNEGNCTIHTMDRINSLWVKSVGARLTYKTLIGAM